MTPKSGIGRALLVGAVVFAAVMAWTIVDRQAVQGRDTGSKPDLDVVQMALQAGKPTVAEFGSATCSACRGMKQVLAELARSHDARISLVDVDLVKQRDVDYIGRYRIMLMPTQVFFDAQGREIDRHMGALTGQEILQRLRVEAAQ